jgi:hypothetical protein
MSHKKLLKQTRTYLDRLKAARSPLYGKTERKIRRCNRQLGREVKRLSA